LWYWQDTEAAAADARPNLHTKLGTSGSFSRKITRTCVPLMVARIGHNWDAAAVQNLVAPVVQTMVVVHNIAGIQDYEEYDALRENRHAAERTLHQGFQEKNKRGAKAFRDKAREMIMPFFVKGDVRPCHVLHIRIRGLDRPPSPSPCRTSCAPGVHGNSAAHRATLTALAHSSPHTSIQFIHSVG
jgi:hypothetical protein